MKPLQILARRMFPAFVAEEYPQMLTFVEKVFEYMDQEGNQYNVVSNLLAYNDVDTTLDKFESVFRDQYLKNFPDVLSADVDLLVKNIRSFYLNKGTEQSYRFLFGALFDSTVNFKYPKKNILRTSDGLWFTPQYLVITDTNDNIPPQLPDTTVFQVFKLVDKFITGTESGAVAFVDEAVTLSSVGLTYGGNGNVEAISTVESEGAFIPGEQILIGNTIVQNGSFDQDTAFWDINPAGDRGFSTVNNQLVIEQVFGNVKTRYISQTIDADEGSQYWIRFTLTAADTAATRITVGYAPGGIELYDSTNLGSNPLPFSDTVLVGPVDPGKQSITITMWNEMGAAGNACTWDGISLVKEEFLNNVPILFIANIAAESGVLTGESKWKDQRGFLSEGDFSNDREIVLQDGDYYQDFSYEVKSQISINRFESIVKDLLHPAGFKMFSAVVAADGLVVYSFRESYYNDLTFTDGAPSTITRVASGKPFTELFRPNDVVSIGEDSGANEGWVIVDTVDSTTLTLRSGFSLAGGNFTGTEIKLWSGIGIIDMPEVEFLSKNIEDPLNVNEQYYTTIEITDATTMIRDVADGKPFDEWISVGQYLYPGREFDPLHRRRFKVTAVTATSVTIDSVSNFSSKILNETVSGYSRSYDTELVRLKLGLTLHTPGTYMNVEFGVDFEFKHGFGVTWADAERTREFDNRTVAEWSGLKVNDFLAKATERFGFINQWEIDVVPFVVPSSNDPNIVWDFYEPLSVANAEFQTSSYINIYFYEGSNLKEGPVYDSSCGSNYFSGVPFAQSVIADAVTNFSTGEFLTKWEKDTLYSGTYDNFTANYVNGNDGTWFDLFRFNYGLDSDNSPYDGVQHMRVKIYVATDDGFGAPVPGSDTWKWVTFYAHGSIVDHVIRDTFTDTAGTLLAAHTVTHENFVPGTWADVTNALEIDASGRITGTVAAENSGVIDSGNNDVDIQIQVDMQDETNSIGVGARYTSAGTYGYHLELDLSGLDPTLTLYAEWNSVRSILDVITLWGENSNGIIGVSDCYLQMTANGTDIYGEFYCGQNNGRVYRVHWNELNDTIPWWSSENHVMVRGDGINANWIEDFDVSDASETTGRPREAVIIPDQPAQPDGFVMYVIPNGSFKLELPEDSGWPNYTPLTYDFWVDWGDGTANDHITAWNQAEITHSAYPASATQRYPIHIYSATSMSFDYSASTTHRSKIYEIKQWGDVSWQSLQSAFERCNNLKVIAADAPDLSSCLSVDSMFSYSGIETLTAPSGITPVWNFGTLTSLQQMFYYADQFNGDVGDWDTSAITNFQRVFARADDFTGIGVENWDVGAGTSFYQFVYVDQLFAADLSAWRPTNSEIWEQAFSYCDAFNCNLSAWNMSKVTSTKAMFDSSDTFNGDVSTWVMPLNTDMSSMFADAGAFNQDLNSWNTSACTDMNFMFGSFSGANIFNGNITSWNTGNVTKMNGMFRRNSTFNQAIDGWNVTKVEDFGGMFEQADAFNQPLNSWTINTLTPVLMDSMFAYADIFNQPLNNWDVSEVTTMASMFQGALLFNSSLAGWNASKVQYFSSMFNTAPVFNQAINDWTLGAALGMGEMFRSAAAFNQPLNTWDVSTVTSMYAMFNNADAFNSSLSAWTLTAIADMRYLFAETLIFNQAIDNWTLGTGVKDMTGMFKNADGFNQSLNSWNVSNVDDFSEMFMNTALFNGNITSWLSTASTPATVLMVGMFDNAVAFDQAIGSWDVTKVTSMNRMFQQTTAFNQALSGWTPTAVFNMSYMFYGAVAFDQDLGGWDVTNATIINQFLGASVAFSTANYDLLLNGWSLLTLSPSEIFDVNATYTIATSQAARDIMTTAPNLWTINDLGGI